MPDWTYRTVSQRVLFGLSPETGREIGLGVIGSIARLPGGKYVIDALGDMIPDARLRVTKAGLSMWSPVGFGIGLDMQLAATAALSRFGVGLIEIGPIGLRAQQLTALQLNARAKSLTWRGSHCLAVADALKRLPSRPDRRVAIMARLHADNKSEFAQLVVALRPRVAVFSIEVAANAEATPLLQALISVAAGVPVMVILPTAIPHAARQMLAQAALQAGCAGFVVDGTLRTDGIRVFSPEALSATAAAVALLREEHGDQPLIIATGGVHEPADALLLRHAGADVIEVDGGLIFNGPGLAKRCDDAFLHDQLAQAQPTQEHDAFDQQPYHDVLQQSWFWFGLLGLSMVFGSVLAAFIALIHVVLPYDEVFVGLSKAALAAVNPHLLDFLVHDRMTLAGLMCTAGMGYTGLALFGVRRGWRWAEGAILASSIFGMSTFFLFLGFGYFEPFHGFVTAILAQFLISGMRSRIDSPMRVPQPALRETAAWRASLWGQLCWIMFGLGLLGAGAAISIVGITEVFVPEDLHFMNTTVEALMAASPRLVPMIAHDRASVGGMLLACGFLYLLPALWGFRRGERWLWWTHVLAGIPAFTAVIWTHLQVGYLDLWHLAPVLPALLIFAAGAALSRAFLWEGHGTR